MAKKNLVLQVNIAPIVISYLIASTISFASTDVVSNSEVVKDMEKEVKITKLETFFDRYNSPLKDYSRDFVETAEKYDMDYKLLPAIACMESSCGKNLIHESYNPFGWGIYGNQAIYFENYTEAIETVGKGISENYIARGYETPEEIAPIYTPPNHVNWLSGVKYFINEIEGASAT
jgi:hypothetical protein